MAATTITRTGVTLTNDTGTAASPNGDGTLLNNAWVQTFMDRIDSLISGNIRFGGTLTVEGFGTHALSAGGTGANVFQLRNTSAGTGNYSQVQVGNDSDAAALFVTALSSTFTTAGVNVADGGAVGAGTAGGLSLCATHASGALRFYSGGSTERGRFTSAGHFVLPELTTNPGTGDLAADAAMAIYTKADKFVIAYNNSGTVTYITLDFDGSDVTWAHSTSAP